jgi:TrmH family RNA methyltransferase
MHITSTQNALVKQIARLYDAQERTATGLLLIEGLRELSLALQHNIALENLFHCPEILQKIPQVNCPVITVTKTVFEKLTFRGSTGGILAVAKQPQKTLADIQLPEDPLIVVMEHMEKPGNIGAILRTANAAHVDAVLVCDEATDLYNPNTIRASLGAIFTTPTVSCTSQEAIAYLKKNKIKILAATPHTERTYYNIDMQQGVAITIGSEKDGLTEQWLKTADEKILIPMRGEVDSLNASTSGAILIYEAVRQRQ